MAKARVWPNGLGWDVGTSEVWKAANGRLRVFTTYRVAMVTSTTEPEEAVLLTYASGHLRSELEAMNYEDAQQLFLTQTL